MLQVGRLVCIQEGDSVASDVIGSALECIATMAWVCGRMEVVDGGGRATGISAKRSQLLLDALGMSRSFDLSHR